MAKAVLVVDDDPDIRDTLKDIIEQQGYSVVTAENGRVALSVLLKAKERFGVVLLDLMMPVMGGMEFLNELNVTYPDFARAVPIVLITAAPVTGGRELMLRTMVKEVIRKPFLVDHLIELVKKYCGAIVSAAAEPLQRYNM